ETAAATEGRMRTGLGQFVASMWPATALALVLGASVAAVRPEALAVAAPILSAWALSPVVAFWVSRPKRVVETPLSDDERRALRRIARKTWAFFETFVGDDSHWLPPTTSRRSPTAGSRTAPRRRTRACSCSRRSRPTTWATSGFAAWCNGW